jgi:hypothetical protein
MAAFRTMMMRRYAPESSTWVWEPLEGFGTREWHQAWHQGRHELAHEVGLRDGLGLGTHGDCKITSSTPNTNAPS